MASFSFPSTSGGSGVAIYSTIGAFPAASSVQAGSLAVAADTGILYESNATTWRVIAGPGTVLSLGAFGNTPNANGLSLSSNVLTLQPADATHPGGVPNIGSANGVASLDGSGKVPISQLPSAVMEYQGVWNPATNTPTLNDTSGSPVNGYTYRVSVAHTGSISGLSDPSMNIFYVGDFVVYSGALSVWQRSPAADGVTSVNTLTGAVTLTQGNLTEATSSVLTLSGGTNAVWGSGTSIQVKQSSGSVSGYLSSTDWTTFNNKQATLSLGTVTETTSSILTLTGWTNATVGSPTITVKQASGSQAGYLSSADWTTFNGKASTGFTTPTTGSTFGNVTAGSITGVNVTAVGVGAGAANTSGHDNVFLGFDAGNAATTANFATVVGSQAVGTGIMTGANNTAIGYQAGKALTGAVDSVYIGYQAGVAATTQADVTAIGSGAAGGSSFAGAHCTLVGFNAGIGITSGTFNTGIGDSVFHAGLSGGNNTAVGASAGFALTSGHENVLIGYGAGQNISSGASNIGIGYNTLASITATTSGSIAIGTAVDTGNFSNSIAIAPGDTTAATIACTASNQFALGDTRTDSFISAIYLGKGAVGNATSQAVTMALSPIVTGTSNIAGGNFTIQPGNGTGTGGSGSLIFQTAPVAGSSTSPNTMQTVMKIQPAGTISMPLLTAAGALVNDSSGNVTSTTTATPGLVLTSNGSTSAPSWAPVGTPAYANKTAAYSVVNTDAYLTFDMSGSSNASYAATLETAVGNTGVTHTFIVKVGTGILSLNTTSSQTVGGYASGKIQMATVNDSITVFSDGANWQIREINISVSARYDGSSTTVNGTDAIISWTNKRWDPLSMMSSGTITVPFPGKYQINTGLQINGTYTSGVSMRLAVYHAGSVQSQSAPSAETSASGLNAELSDIVQMTAGDTITIEASSDASGPTISATAARNWVSIQRIGN